MHVGISERPYTFDRSDHKLVEYTSGIMWYGTNNVSVGQYKITRRDVFLCFYNMRNVFHTHGENTSTKALCGIIYPSMQPRKMFICCLAMSSVSNLQYRFSCFAPSASICKGARKTWWWRRRFFALSQWSKLR